MEVNNPRSYIDFISKQDIVIDGTVNKMIRHLGEVSSEGQISLSFGGAGEALPVHGNLLAARIIQVINIRQDENKGIESVHAGLDIRKSRPGNRIKANKDIRLEDSIQQPEGTIISKVGGLQARRSTLGKLVRVNRNMLLEDIQQSPEGKLKVKFGSATILGHSRVGHVEASGDVTIGPDAIVSSAVSLYGKVLRHPPQATPEADTPLKRGE